MWLNEESNEFTKDEKIEGKHVEGSDASEKEIQWATDMWPRILRRPGGAARR